MTLYRYTSSQARDYPNLEHADGIGLHLEPGDTIELDMAPVDDYVDGEPVASHYPGCPWLVPDGAAATVPVAAPQPAAAAPTPAPAPVVDVEPSEPSAAG